jgi:hypothetical protein
VRRPRFWALIALASALEALAAAALSAAAFSLPLDGANIHTFGYREFFGRAVSLDWASDGGLLVATATFGVLGLGTYVLASRSR